MSTMPDQREMEKAMLGGDASYIGVFFVAVKTTGIFCRPGCPARKPRPQNVEYFPSSREALLAGYRPCKRCRPMDVNGRPPDWVQALFAEVERDPTARLRDRDLRALSIDPIRARRYFTKHYGMTFQAYNRARRMGVALARIREGGRLSEVALHSGYESESGFREAFERTFGAAPGRSRASDCIVATTLESPFGSLLAGATDDALCLLEFADRRAIETQIATLRKRLNCAIVPGENRWIKQAKRELVQYFARKRTAFDVPLSYPGTEFQQQVWKQLLEIPYGQTISYEQLADGIGRKGAQRAVGLANGKNRIAIIIPCHRVVNKNGQLGGYGGSLWRKQFLLDLEQGRETKVLF